MDDASPAAAAPEDLSLAAVPPEDLSLAAVPPEKLRRLVAEVLAEVLPGLARPATTAPTSTRPAPPPGAGDVPDRWSVRVSNDDELHALVLRVLKLADNPKVRADLIGGRVRFSLAGQPARAVAQAVQRVDKGAVTERVVERVAQAGARLVLGRRAVLTPLARDKARALGVPIEKER